VLAVGAPARSAPCPGLSNDAHGQNQASHWLDWRSRLIGLAAAGGEGPCVDIMEISKPDDLGDIANLGLTLAEAKQLLARVQCEISTAQARDTRSGGRFALAAKMFVG
jgi:hypothetical protein